MRPKGFSQIVGAARDPAFPLTSLLPPRIFVDVDECTPGGGNDCDPNAECVDASGTFSCACKPGFTGSGKACSGGSAG
jgi:hypothetical protein